jgi:hypothetical protein
MKVLSSVWVSPTTVVATAFKVYMPGLMTVVFHIMVIVSEDPGVRFVIDFVSMGVLL